jgi:hypothetical protein
MRIMDKAGGGGLRASLRVGLCGWFREEERFVGVSGLWTSEVVEIEAGTSARGREMSWGSREVIGGGRCRRCEGCCWFAPRLERVRLGEGAPSLSSPLSASLEMRRSGEDMDGLRREEDRKGVQPISGAASLCMMVMAEVGWWWCWWWCCCCC